MKIINKLELNPAFSNPELTLAIGNFDGVHLGHQKMIQTVISFKDTQHALMTFDPHPIDFFKKTDEPRLTTSDDKKQIFSEYGIDYLFLLKFDSDFSSLTKEQFIELLKKYNVKRVVVGKDAKFGHKGAGTYLDLLNHFDVVLLEDYNVNLNKISTTYIKQLLDNGKLDEVKEALGHEYSIKGIIEHGDKVGRTIGFPTANVDYKNYYLPKIGVYYVKVVIDNKEYVGTASLGYNPTLNNVKKKRLEVFIHDFNENIYGKAIEVKFINYLRTELKFSSKEELIKQINDDILQTKIINKKKNI
ncbi:Bifunctional enzyme, FAD synthetase / riboflavin kinase [Alteracholeplasma palmae J233]|uniref:Riboflavin biosynthesis protein n=1 Tax=Alteracholeplasma palmae (strain ATCC 49389 / J233) TaxID=1318466 RepID=U4KL73_ALTPJ|nr:bifunctional riboflavin kinase/FAD synthetase [Alteracholeplasma palmae]CCV64503.1 Bifunctional enzyme, FAD synthetase / riboflavin kinase [Alteracholeplasma palmae J233]